MKNMNPKKKVTWIINSVMILSAIAIVATAHYIKTKYNMPTLVLYACSIPVLIGGFILFSKWLENSKWKDTIEEMEKEAEEEEPTKPKHIPGSFGLILLAIICLGFSIDNGIDLTAGIFSNAYEPEQFLKVIVPDCIGVFTILTCSVIIAIIAYNVMKKKIFTSVNARLIYSIGAIVIVSVIIQTHYWETTTMMPNDTVGMIFALFGAFIVFFGRVFAIGVKIKEEQDLTI
jgi:membrane protein YdbS with pleckstrin-like domain